MAKKYQTHITVRPADIDHMGHVNNVVYVRWVQEVASRHWLSAAAKKDVQKFRWVVLRHEIDYLKPALPGEKLIAVTWMEALEGIKSIRMVEIRKGETVLARARTTWVMLDAHTGRPARVTEEIKKPFL